MIHLENVLKISLQDVLKMSCRRFCKTSWRRVAKTNILVLTKTSWKRLEDVFWRRTAKANKFVLMKTSWRRRRKTSSRGLQDVFIKTNVCWVVSVSKYVRKLYRWWKKENPSPPKFPQPSAKLPKFPWPPSSWWNQMNDLSLSVYVKKWIIVFIVNKLILIYSTWFVDNFVNYKYKVLLKSDDVCFMPFSIFVTLSSFDDGKSE